MKTNYELRYASHPEDAKKYDTSRLRREYLIETIFSENEVNMVYSLYDRLIVGGAMPVNEILQLESIDPLKSDFFLSRREFGTFNVGGAGKITVDGTTFELGYKEALYLGAGNREVTFESIDAKNPAKFYFNSAPAHKTFPDRKITRDVLEALRCRKYAEVLAFYLECDLDDIEKQARRLAESTALSYSEALHKIGGDMLRSKEKKPAPLSLWPIRREPVRPNRAARRAAKRKGGRNGR